jgi:hypothetical protein
MKITVAQLRDLLHQYGREEISMSRFVELLNEGPFRELRKANELIRSFYSVAQRHGTNTCWEALQAQTGTVLGEQHHILYPDQCHQGNVSLSSITAWVSVNERLPSVMEDVLCMDEHGNCSVCYFCQAENQWYLGTPFFAYYDFTITHWMPLPELPTANISSTSDTITPSH